jgi:hypothetical protein
MTFPTEFLPTAERMAELHPESSEDWRATHGYRRQLRANPDASAILDAGQAAVPDLVRLLGEADREMLAAVLLSEIGGREAAQGLLARWRETRARFQEKSAYLHSDGEVYSQGVRTEGPGSGYGKVLYALKCLGREVGTEVAADTAAAMDEAERIQRAGNNVIFEERVQEPEGEVELRWQVEPIEAACEGLQILAMAGAPEGVDPYVRALRSPVRSFRWHALQYVPYLGHGLDRTLPAIGAMIDDPEWRDLVLGALATIWNQIPPRDPSPDKEEKLVARYKRRLQELGHLPK